ncbi:penicillin-binding transpeptidase domain-containing protein [Herbidospora mongoliensis]|uniref:penicillin-binding transpeptidase domain-containing protein n=1 Tax=Herbidospora mongoliensis TaxID=688067 RepID=UPI0008317D53|nr:penicillin-binding transpeptidase domain-containing protein [Herbidospora mongoliensis]
MRRRPLLVLVAAVVTMFVAGVTGLIVSGRSVPPPEPVTTATPADVPDELVEPENRNRNTPLEAGTAYLKVWERGDLAAMRELVSDPPEDFTSLHQAADAALQAAGRVFTPLSVDEIDDATADLSFTGEWKMADGPPMKLTSTVRLIVVGRRWMVDWSPDAIFPDLEHGDTIERRDLPGAPYRLATREGEGLPPNSYADSYVDELAAHAPPNPSTGGWRVVIEKPFGDQVEEVYRHEQPVTEGPVFTTTIDKYVQMAAARALDPVQNPAALVAMKPSTGEVLAVADRLGGKGAFSSPFPPGSTFKIVTAAALLGAGVTPDQQVPCPAQYQIPGWRLISNYQNHDFGTISFRQAFAESCNTTFAQLAVERVPAATLSAQAAAFGFGATLSTGAGGTCGSLTEPHNPDALAEASFGQGTVQATPLCMATVAAAVQSGVWRAPRLLTDAGAQPPDAPLAPGVADGLRTMMSSVVSEGTAENTGLPAGVSGKTGTAEQAGQHDHAWFVGFHDDLAFAVFVKNGGTGRDVAIPVAARFLNAL